jgi:hypothetical protein
LSNATTDTFMSVISAIVSLLKVRLSELFALNRLP